MTIHIRLAKISDAPQIQSIYAPIVRDTFISFEQVVPAVDEIAGRIANTLLQYPWLVCESEGQITGYAYASSFRARPAYQWTTEVTVYMHPDFHRRGIARALYTALFAVLREQGYFNAVGVIALPNPGSVGLHEAMGFEKIGVFKNMGYKHSQWRDTGWWQLELRPMPENPSAPIAITELSHQPKFVELLKTGMVHIKSAQ